MSTIFEDQSRYELNDGTWVRRGGQALFAYTDGDEVESRIRSIVEHAADKSLFSEELRDGITDWPTFYHLSAARANLLRPFGKKLAGKTILEIGSGCGAITRFLAETGADVVAIEGSLNRARVTRERTRDIPNVQVVCDQIPDFSLDMKFDIVVVVGVLEYARTTLVEAACPELEFAKSLRPLLNRDGVIILAIENQLGVKYFSGAKEDHTGKAFYGISNQYGPKTPVTFGRQVLSNLLREAGFLHQDWYYPFPDYKVPVSIVSEACLEQIPSLATALVAPSGSSDRQRAINPLFSLEAIWDLLSQNGLIRELANSFLVVVGETAKSLEALRDKKELAWHYSDRSRHPAFLKEVRFESAGSKFVVRRTALTTAPPPSFPIRCHTVDEPYVAGANWWLKLVKIINMPGWSVPDVAEWCQFWLDQLSIKLKSEKLALVRDSATLIPGRYIDAVPFNLIITHKERGHFIDQEWELDRDIELGFLVYRSLYASFTHISGAAEPEINTSLVIHELIQAVGAQVEVTISDLNLRRYHDLEQTVQQWVQGKAESDIDLSSFESRNKETIFCRQTSQARPDENQHEVALKAILAVANEELRQLRNEVTDRDQQLIAADRDLRRLMVENEDRDRRLVTAASELAKSIAGAEQDRQALTRQIHDAETRLKVADEALRIFADQIEDRNQKLVAADQDLRRLVNEIEEREQKLVAADGGLRRLTGEMGDREKKLLAADSELRRLTDLIQDREQKLVAADGDLRRLTDDVTDREHRLVLADSGLRRLTDEVKDRDEKLAAAHGDLHRLSGEVRDRDQMLVAAQADLRNLSDELESRDRQLATTDGVLRHLTEEIAVRDRKLVVADVGLRRLTAEIEDCHVRLRQLMTEISLANKQLEDRESQRRALEKRLNDIETSAAWRMTAPLRKFSSS
jgi:SAM-dependent methyltransferase/uncharacterized protein (DUF3084 family)